ncbi:hypothetical protein CCAX7_37270 [Capsulimonas corticalis]|uniref:Uncharacterized protein n=1 Tax=Capsulimonas corticalis TaxID=2219043 RepID=A0A402D143_9BACT|nr:hypothetical protein CCAX7_37270 [Capsulimonas corticalis]
MKAFKEWIHWEATTIGLALLSIDWFETAFNSAQATSIFGVNPMGSWFDTGATASFMSAGIFLARFRKA